MEGQSSGFLWFSFRILFLGMCDNRWTRKMGGSFWFWLQTKCHINRVLVSLGLGFHFASEFQFPRRFPSVSLSQTAPSASASLRSLSFGGSPLRTAARCRRSSWTSLSWRPPTPPLRRCGRRGGRGAGGWVGGCVRACVGGWVGACVGGWVGYQNGYGCYG